MHMFFETHAPLAQNSNAHPWDVVKIKSLLQALGHYEAPDWGLSEFPDRALFDAIRAFQKELGLRVDGVLKPQGETQMALAGAVSQDQSRTALRMAAEFVRQQGRNGDTVLAHITPEEAQVLHAVTDGGSINPTTGLLEFFTDRQLEAADKANESAARTRERVREYVSITRERSSQGQRNDDAGRRDAWNEAKTRVSNRNADGGSDNRTMQHNSSTGTQTPGGMMSANGALKTTVNDEEENAERQQRAHLAQKQEEEDEQRQTLGSDPLSPRKKPNTPKVAEKPAPKPASNPTPKHASKPKTYSAKIMAAAAQANQVKARDRKNVKNYLAATDRIRAEGKTIDAKTRADTWAKVTGKKTATSGGAVNRSGPSVTMPIPLTKAETELLQKAERLGINPDEVDLNDPNDKALIESYYEYGNKTPEERKQAQKIKDDYRKYAVNNPRASNVYDAFKAAEGASKNYAAESGSLGYLSDDRLRDIRNGNFGIAATAKVIGKVAPPVGIIGLLGNKMFKDASEELQYRESLRWNTTP